MGNVFGWCRAEATFPLSTCRGRPTALAEAAKGADLVVLEGMGRAIETNLRAKLVCDALKLGMVKHPEVATCLGGEPYDCVCRFGRGQGRVSTRGASSLTFGNPHKNMYERFKP